MFNNTKLFAQALGIQKPWKLDEVKFNPEEGQLDIYISHVTGSLLPCPDCQQESSILVGEHDTRIWRVIRHYVNEARAKEDYSCVEQVGIDETSSRRGHNYVSIFVDLEQSKVLFASEGKDASTVKRFTQDLSNHKGNPDNIKDVTCDMSPAYIKGVTDSLPNARITFDKFHVMKIVNEAVDQVRRMEQKDNSSLKSTRYLWLKNPSNLTENQRKNLLSLSSMNLRTVRAYNIKLSFQEFWNIKSKEIAEQYLKRWYFWATHSKLEPIRSVAYTIKSHWEGILNYISSQINNGVLEAINGLIQSAKRKASGYRNIENLITIIYLSCGKLTFDIPVVFG